MCGSHNNGSVNVDDNVYVNKMIVNRPFQTFPAQGPQPGIAKAPICGGEVDLFKASMSVELPRMIQSKREAS